MANEIGHPIGPMGWVVPDATTLAEMLDKEKRFFAAAQAAAPAFYEPRPMRAIDPDILTRWNSFQESKGRFAGSNDFSLLDEFVFGRTLTWLPQDIGSCFPAGTLVRMADGSHKPIESVGLFSQVLTAEGNVSFVSQAKGRYVDEDIYEIKLWGHLKVRMTHEHPVLTKRGYVKASELTLDDYVSVPRYAPQTAMIVQTEQHARCNDQMRRKIKACGSVGSHKVWNGYVSVYRSVPDMIDLTEEFGTLCGLYLAEGGTDGNKLVFTFNKNESETLAKQVVDLFHDLFDVDAVLSFPKKSPNTCKVSVHSVAWSSLFESLLGNGSQSKRLHSDLACGPIAFLKSVYEGWMAGDGHHSKNGADGVTISKQLAFDMHAVMNAIGVQPRIQSHQPSLSHGVESRQVRYDVLVSETDHRMCSEQTDKHVWRKVREISTTRFTGKVYNFEVNGDNSYVADGIGVHNCVWSNTFRRWVERATAEIGFYGQPEEWIGMEEFGPNSLAPFCVSYGFAREIANMRGGDGLYCSPMQKSLVQDGVVLCSNPKLAELLSSVGAGSTNDFPEVRSTSLYRKIGDWAWNSALRPHATCKLLESPKVTTYEQFLKNEDEFKPMFSCSGLAIKIAGQHPDGFTYHTENTQDSWAHNMGLGGRRVTSKGDIFHRVDNTSWLSPEQPNRDSYVYWIAAKEVKKWFDQGKIDVGTIGEIEGIKSIPRI